MSRRKSSNDLGIELFGYMIYLIFLFYYLLAYISLKLLLFTLKLIIFNLSDYKKKSGNGFLKTYFSKGNWGEYKYYKKLVKSFGKENVLTNLYLPNDSIDNTEIDLIAVKNGIVYCYEVKNYSGRIYGKKSDRYWTYVISYRNKYKFYNPIRQNQTHVNALKNYLSIDENYIVPLVVFSNKANLEHIYGESLNVIKFRTPVSFSNITSNYKDEELLTKLSECTLVDKKVKKEHIRQIRELRSFN